MNGFFITIEGIDGCGKTTQTDLLVSHLREQYEVVQTREPGGCPTAEMIRSLVLPPPYHGPLRRRTDAVPIKSDLTELLLMEAARAEHFHSVIIPVLNNGKIIVCDRNIDSTIAYQGYGRGLDIETIKQLNNIAAQGIMPHMTLLFDIDPETSYKRIQTEELDRLEEEGLSFQKKVREGYLACAKKNEDRIKVIPVGKEPIDTIHSLVVSIVNSKLETLDDETSPCRRQQ